MVMNGPLAPWASGMAEQLNGLGYARRTAAVQMALAGKLSRFLEHTEAACTAAFSSDGRFALSGSYDRTVRLWRLPK